MNLYEKIQKLCEIRGISVNRLEKEAGIGRGSIAKWANSIPSVQKIAAVATALDVPIEHLLSGISNDMKSGNNRSNIDLNDVAVRLLLSKEKNQNNLSSDEKNYLDLFRQLSDDDKVQILRIMKLYVEENRKSQTGEKLI